MIRKVNVQDDFGVLATLLNSSFATIAEEFGLTRENAPTNNAFITGDALKSQLTDNREFYVYEEAGSTIGFIAIEQASNTPETFYIEKLAVIPDYRHSGIGRKLMDFATNKIMESGGKCISIGLIDSNTVLKEWYGKQGYVVSAVKTYDHLPFDVCLMEKHPE